MKTQRFVVIADRADGSSIGATDLHATEVVALVERALTLAAKLTIVPERAGVAWAPNQSPVLTLDELLAWQQPDDALTQLFRGDDEQEHSTYKPEAAVLYDGTPGSGSIRRSPRTGLTLDDYNQRFVALLELFRDGHITADDASAEMRKLTSQHIWR